MKYFLLALLPLSLLVSCGDKTGSKYAPLTSDQMTKVGDVATASARPLNATKARNAFAQAGFAPLFETLSLKNDDKTQKMARRLAQAEAANQCVIQEPFFNSNDQTSMSFTASTKGRQCPVLMDVDLSMRQTGPESAAIKFFISLGFNDEELKELNDVSLIEISGNGSGGNSGITASARGKIVSAQYGEIQVEMDATASVNDDGSGNMDSSLRFIFKDFTAEFKVVAEDGQGKLTLNGKELTKEDIARLANTDLGQEDPAQPEGFPIFVR